MERKEKIYEEKRQREEDKEPDYDPNASDSESDDEKENKSMSMYTFCIMWFTLWKRSKILQYFFYNILTSTDQLKVWYCLVLLFTSYIIVRLTFFPPALSLK